MKGTTMKKTLKLMGRIVISPVLLTVMLPFYLAHGVIDCIKYTAKGYDTIN